MFTLAFVTNVVLLWLSLESRVKCDCPADTDELRRVGQTRFYILHKEMRGDYVGFQDAYGKCKALGLEMAKVKNMRTMGVVGRELEKIVVQYNLKDTWYWLDAKYDSTKQIYVWGDGSEDVQYSNFLYRPPRPTGLAGFVNHKGEYQPNNDVEQCITLALPWPGKADPNGKGVIYGHHTMLDERPCESVQKRHAICESTDASCKEAIDDPFEFTEDKVNYFEEGNWIFGDRKYIINWKHRSSNDSGAYCEQLGLKLFEPERNETGLIPYIKMWSREVTTSQFWTGYSFNSIDKKFLTPSKVEIFEGEEWKQQWKEKDNVNVLQARSSKLDPDFCVAMVHSYEFKGQLPCIDQASDECQWSFVDYVPANCNNYLGVICQHEDKSNRSDNWDPKFIVDVDLGLRETAVTKEFGFAGNIQTVRSKYKQTFGILHCPTGYRMLRENNTKAFSEPPTIPPGSNSTGTTGNRLVYAYDYLESYWVVDKDLFNKDKDSDCTLSVPKDATGYTREIKKVKCVEWHFYACEKTSNKTKEPEGVNQQTPPKMIWKEGPQPRIYPLLTSKMKTLPESSPPRTSGRMDNFRTGEPGKERPKKKCEEDEDGGGDNPRSSNMRTSMYRSQDPDYDSNNNNDQKGDSAGNDRFILKNVNQTKNAFTLFKLNR